MCGCISKTIDGEEENIESFVIMKSNQSIINGSEPENFLIRDNITNINIIIEFETKLPVKISENNSRTNSYFLVKSENNTFFPANPSSNEMITEILILNTQYNFSLEINCLNGNEKIDSFNINGTLSIYNWYPWENSIEINISNNYSPFVREQYIATSPYGSGQSIYIGGFGINFYVIDLTEEIN